MMLSMNVCVAICPHATKATSIVHVERGGAIRVNIQGERERRYRLTPLTATSGPSHAAEWMERCGEEAIDGVIRGGDVLLLSTGQVGLSKRATMFHRPGGIVWRFLKKLWKTLEEQKSDVACSLTLWEIRDREILDLLRPTGPPFTSSLFCHSVPLASMEDIAVLLKGALTDAPSAECLSHLFLRLTMQRNNSLHKSSVCFVDMADTPFLTRHASHGLSSERCCAIDGSSDGVADLRQVSRMISSMAKRGRPHVISLCSCNKLCCDSGVHEASCDMGSVKQQHGILAAELRKRLADSMTYAVCSVSDRPEDALNTIHTLRLATQISRIPNRTPSEDVFSNSSPRAVFQNATSFPADISATSQTPCPLSCRRPAPHTSHLTPPCAVSDGICCLHGDVLFSSATKASQEMSKDEEEGEAQSINRTLLNLIDKQKRMQDHMECCLEDSKTAKAEALLHKEVRWRVAPTARIVLGVLFRSRWKS